MSIYCIQTAVVYSCTGIYPDTSRAPCYSCMLYEYEYEYRYEYEYNRGTGTGIVSRYRYRYHVAASKVMLRLHSAHVPTRGLFLSEKRDLRHELKAVNSASQVQNLLWESCVAM